MEQKIAALPDSVATSSTGDNAINVDTISMLMLRLSEYGVELNLDLFRTLISGLCREGKWQEAHNLYKSMEDNCLLPDEEIYKSLLLVLAKNYKVDLALFILNEMAVRGFEPSMTGYRLLICALCNLNRREEASHLFESMLPQQWSPDEIAWTILIDGLLKEGEADLCMKFLHIMEAKDYAPTFQALCYFEKSVSHRQENCTDTVLLVNN